MKAKEGIIEFLNNVLTNELTAINQYFIHAEICKNWGYERLYHKDRSSAIEEMKHAEEVIEHILYLEGMPNMQRLGTVGVGETVPEQFKLDLKLEEESVKLLNEAIAHCVKVGDNTTRHKLEDILKDSEEHVDWLETQLEAIKQVGVENYLGHQIRKEES